MRYVLQRIPYNGCDENNCGELDPLIVTRANITP